MNTSLLGLRPINSHTWRVLLAPCVPHLYAHGIATCEDTHGGTAASSACCRQTQGISQGFGRDEHELVTPLGIPRSWAQTASCTHLAEVEVRLDFFQLDTNIGFADLALASSDAELDAAAKKKPKKAKKKAEL